jgi:hypothetical protein
MEALEEKNLRDLGKKGFPKGKFGLIRKVTRVPVTYIIPGVWICSSLRPDY